MIEVVISARKPMRDGRGKWVADQLLSRVGDGAALSSAPCGRAAPRPDDHDADGVEPDPDWYIDHVVVPSGPECAPVGPLRSGQAEWLVRRRALQQEREPSLRRLNALASRQGFVLTREQALTVGLTDADLRRLVRRGEWSRPRHGVLAPLALPDDAVLAATSAALVRPGEVISYASAGVIHSVPLLQPVGPPSLTSAHLHPANSRDNLRLHVAALPADEVEDWFGTPVTTIERTVVDLARACGVESGIVAADAALHERLTTPRRLRRALARQTGWPGVRAARFAIDVADARSESPAESLARLCLIRADLPLPDLQVWVDTERRTYRVDMLYRRERVIVEVDGMLKYQRPGSLAAEKRRQEYLERAGYVVVRLLWDDIVQRPWEGAARVRAACAQRAASRY